MIERFALLLAVFVAGILPGNAAPKSHTNSEYRFSVTVPEGWSFSDDYPADKSLKFYARKGKAEFAVHAIRAGKKKVFSFRKILRNKGNSFPDDVIYIGKAEHEPFYNLLRHSVCRTYRTAQGEYVRQLVTMRARTLFTVYATSTDGNFSETDPLFDSFDIDLTRKGNFLLAKNNIGTLWGCVLLSLFPYLGWFTGSYFRKWRRSCRTDKRSLKLLFACLGATALLFLLVYVTLRDDMGLAGIVGGVMLLFWLFFASNNKFLKEVYNGIFE